MPDRRSEDRRQGDRRAPGGKASDITMSLKTFIIIVVCAAIVIIAGTYFIVHRAVKNAQDAALDSGYAYDEDYEDYDEDSTDEVEETQDDSDEETESYVSVEDEETLTKVFEMFKDKFKNEFDFVD